MNKETLKLKAEEWTLERALAHVNYCPAPDINPHTNKYWEYADDGMYLMSGAGVRFFKNDGTILTLSRDRETDPECSNSLNDFEIVNRLAKDSLSQSFRIAEMTEFAIIETCGELREYRAYRSPNDKLGRPFLAEYWKDPGQLDKNFLMEFIDQQSWLIQTLNSYGASYYPLRLGTERRLRNDDFFYFYDMQQFAYSYDYFYDHVMGNLQRAVSRTMVRKGILPQFNITGDEADIIAYAEQKWKL